MGNANSGRRKQEVCQNGHKLEGDNLIIIKRNSGRVERACRECRNARQREYWRRKHGKR